jgi:lipoate-protein ligase A
MRLIISKSKDVYFNLALEDVLLHGTNEDILMLWQSHSAVVCGKHQNICGEANYGYCKKNNINLARRLSGGGTVYHDEGNVNFTFIQSLKPHEELNINFRKFLDPVMEVLADLGVHAEYSGRNDLLLNGFKISGNAEHLDQKNRRVLHHGTLLFDSKLTTLGEALHSRGQYESKAVKSVRSAVCNIKPYTEIEDVTSFIDALASGFTTKHGYLPLELTSEEVASAQELQNNKYGTNPWVLGYSPAYKVEKELLLYNKSVKITMTVHKGIITEAAGIDNKTDNLGIALAGLIGKTLNTEAEKAFFQTLNIPYTEEYHYCLF